MCIYIYTYPRFPPFLSEEAAQSAGSAALG